MRWYQIVLSLACLVLAMVVGTGARHSMDGGTESAIHDVDTGPSYAPTHPVPRIDLAPTAIPTTTYVDETHPVVPVRPCFIDADRNFTHLAPECLRATTVPPPSV